MARVRDGDSDWMAAELRLERERSNLVTEELTNLLDGAESLTEKRRTIGKPSITERHAK